MIMNVKLKKPNYRVTIRSIDFETASLGPVDVEVFHRKEIHQRNDNTSEFDFRMSEFRDDVFFNDPNGTTGLMKWIKSCCSKSIFGRGERKRTRILNDIFEPIVLQRSSDLQDEDYSISVIMETKEMLLFKELQKDRNETYIEEKERASDVVLDSDILTVTVTGIVPNLPFDGKTAQIEGILWNGYLRYEVSSNEVNSLAYDKRLKACDNELRTPLDGKKRTFGNIVEVQAKENSLTVESLEFRTVTKLGKSIKYEVYSKRGSYRMFEYDELGWIKVVDGTVASQGKHELTKVYLH